MLTPEGILRDQTFQESGPLDNRIYLTLTMDENCKPLAREMVTHRMARYVAFLTIELKRQGKLDDQSIDDILYSVVQSPAGTRFESLVS